MERFKHRFMKSCSTRAPCLIIWTEILDQNNERIYIKIQNKIIVSFNMNHGDINLTHFFTAADAAAVSASSLRRIFSSAVRSSLSSIEDISPRLVSLIKRARSIYNTFSLLLKQSAFSTNSHSYCNL